VNETVSVSGPLSETDWPPIWDHEYDFLKANIHELSPDESLDGHNVNVQVLNPGNADEGEGTSVAFLVGIISGILDRPVRSGLIVLGETNLMGELVKMNSLVDNLHLASDAGAKRILLPIKNKDDLDKVPNEILDELELLFYRDPINAAKGSVQIS
jgi:ATP-dependent Lon protease